MLLKPARLLPLMLLPSALWAVEPFQIQDIRLEGLQRISAGTVFNYLPLRVGDTFDDRRSGDAIRSLFGTGFFKDVRLERDGDVLLVSVIERPAIADIQIRGNKSIETDPLKESLKQVGLAEGRVFDRALLEKVKQELQRQYFAQGKYAVEIETTQTPLERNRVGIDISVDEGATARIQEIRLVGNTAFPQDDLLDLFQLQTPNWLSWLTKNDRYSRQKLAADLEALRSHYLDQGFINFRIDSTQVTMSPNREEIFVTVNMSEGEQFTVSGVKLAGDLKVDEETLRNELKIENGAVFSRQQVVETNDALVKVLGDEGYAFANINVIPEENTEKNEVELTFFVDPGKRVYVDRINIQGNTRTSDTVLRREMRQFEGARFSTAEVERSKTRLEKLGYFESVAVETPRLPGSTDLVNVNYTVAEQSTGNLMAGLGYGGSSGFVLSTSVSQDNFLGTGKRISFDVNTSNVNTQYGFQFDDPYFTPDGVAIGYGAYFRETDAEDLDVASYTSDTLGLDLRYGIPVNDFDRIRGALGYTHQKLTCGDVNYGSCVNFLSENAKNTNSDNTEGEVDILQLNGRWSHDSRNRAIFPDAGSYQTAFAEFSFPGSDALYYKLGYELQWYHALTRDFTLLLKGNVAYGDGYSDTSDLPFFEKFYAGGISSVRGYKDNTLGPTENISGVLEATGGNFKTVANAEVILPVPFMDNVKGVRLSAFYDVGNVYDKAMDFDPGDLRMSTGMQVNWLSPVGPLNFAFAYPLNDESGDETESFQFTMGRTF
jgi:outer membrane protein insertion porin family